jgi:hypothetical protein
LYDLLLKQCKSSGKSSKVLTLEHEANIILHSEYVNVQSSVKSHDSSVSIVLGYGLDNQGSMFDPWQGLGIFLFTTMSRMALGPTQPPIQWVPGALSLGEKWLECEADHSPPSSA